MQTSQPVLSKVEGMFALLELEYKESLILWTASN